MSDVDNDLDLGGAPASADPFDDVPPDPSLSGEPPVEPGEPGTPSNPIDLSAGGEGDSLGGTNEPPEPMLSELDQEMEAAAAEAAEADGEGEVPPPFPDPSTPVEEPVPTPEEPEPEPEPEPTPEPEPESEPTPEPEPEPEAPKPEAKEAKKEKDKPKGRPSKGKSETRLYYVLEKIEGPDNDETYAVRTTVKAHNGEGAMRQGYRAIDKASAGGELTLVVVAGTYWQPKPVKGLATKNISIEIG